MQNTLSNLNHKVTLKKIKNILGKFKKLYFKEESKQK